MLRYIKDKPYARFLHRNLLAIFLFIGIPIVNANPISGIIHDAKTGEPLPFVNILIKNTTYGTMSDINGTFTLQVKNLPCTLLVKFIGYKDLFVNVEPGRTKLDLKMEEEVRELEEVVVKPDNAFDLMMLRRVIKNRENNTPENIDSINYKEYVRTYAFLANLEKEKVNKSKIWQKAQNALISTSDTTVMAPFFIDETITNHYRNRNKDINSTEQIAEKNDGVLSEINMQVKKFLNKKLTTEFNFYDNQIIIMNRPFPSPISSSSLLYYNVYVTDSILRGNSMYYKFSFFPKSYKNITFKGYFWVEGGSWAITELEASLPNSANFNFVSDFEIRVSYQRLNSGKWFYREQKANFKLAIIKEDGKKQHRNFAIQKHNVYSEIENPAFEQHPVALRCHKPVAIDSMLISERITAPLDTFELAAYNGIKTMKATPFFKFVDKFSAMTLNGYYNLGKFDLGPYFAFYRRNKIEGDRFSIPLRTSSKMWKNFMVGGLVGYGFKNNDLAWAADVGYKFNTKKSTIIKGHFHYDYFDLTRNKFIEFIKENPYQQGSGNVLSSFTATVANPYMLRNRRFSISAEYQVNKSIGLLIRPEYNRYYRNQYLHFIQDDLMQQYFDTQNLTLDARFSFNQDFDEGFFSRIYYGNQKPVFHITALLGRYSLPDARSHSSGFYSNLNFSIKDRYSFGPTFIRMLVEGGGIMGDVPYPLLMLPRGTRDIGSARYYFNLLHHSSYASDLYLSTHCALNGGGILFNKLPLIKHLNLREIVAFKAFYGKLLGDHDRALTMPDYLRKPHKDPYMELSFGVANIFKTLRVEYVRRLNQGRSFDQFSEKHGIRMRLEVSF
jgi:hypothetical protein